MCLCAPRRSVQLLPLATVTESTESHPPSFAIVAVPSILAFVEDVISFQSRALMLG